MTLATILAALALLTAGAFVALAFTAWGRRRPLHRYGALSIAAHLLLLAALANVRTGGPPAPGAEDAPPVRVSLVMKSVAPPEPEPSPEPAPEPEPQPEPAEETTAPPEALPDEPAPAADEPVAPPSPADQTTPTSAPMPEERSIAAAPESAPPTPPAEAPARETAAVPTPATPSVAPTPIPRTPVAPAPSVAEATPAPAAPSAYARRSELQRRRLAEDEGGSDETLDAVAAAVDWLARAQRADGAWDAAAWGAGRQKHYGQHAGARAETGLTGLALLAMGGAGHTHLAGPYRDTVTAGLQFLLNAQGDDGALAGDASLFARTYCHSMATFALAEAMAVTGDQRLRPAVEAAVDHLERIQNRAAGGWRYAPGDRGDTSQMGWAVMALRSAEIAGVAIRPETWRHCEGFIRSVRRGQHGGLAAYQPQGPTSDSMTAEAMYCRQILGVGCRGGCPESGEAVAALLANRPGARRRSSARAEVNLYYWYYATLALHHHRSAGPDADRAWHDWNAALQRAVLSRQVADGPAAGSWGVDTVWGGYGGRVYTTALAAMCLEVDYRYDPEKIGRDPWIAARGGVLRR